LSFFNEKTDTGPGKYDTLATCLKEKGATFYGAFWCPHCRDQKKVFGNSAKLLPYVECSTPDAAGQTQICIDKKIESYPTWEFADGSRVGGGLTPEQLAEKTQCPLTNATSTPTGATTTPITQ
jgi:thiol-disulfide isomerase/thioredoxin